MIWKIILFLLRGPAQPNSACVAACVCVCGREGAATLLACLMSWRNTWTDTEIWTCSTVMDNCCCWQLGTVKRSKACAENSLNSLSLKTCPCLIATCRLSELVLGYKEGKKVGEGADMRLGGLNGRHSWSVCWIWPMTLRAQQCIPLTDNDTLNTLHTYHPLVCLGPKWVQSGEYLAWHLRILSN